MLTGSNLAAALLRVAADLDVLGETEIRENDVGTQGRIRDINGNTVGHWRLDPELP